MTRFAALLACAALSPILAAPALAKTLTYCSEGSPQGFDPAPYTSGTTFDASAQAIYNRLVQFERGTTNVAPGLAESWTVSGDGLEYTFTLRQGVRFQTTDYFTPTRDFNADDVVFTFERQWDEENPYYDYAGATWPYFNGMSMPSALRSIEKVDDHTVKFVLERPDATMPANLAMDFASILSKEYADRLLTEDKRALLDTLPVGTGPFEFVSYERDSFIRYRAHEEYWGGAQAIDDLVFEITPDSAVRLQKLKAGECDVMAYPDPADLAAIRGDASLAVMEQAGLNVGYLAYNTQVAPFDDARVRKALNMAIDKDAIVAEVFQGTGTVATTPIPPTMWAHNAAVEDEPRDPEAARRILDEAGVRNLSMNVWAMPVQRPYNPDARRMAEMIQTDLAEIGVDVEIVTYEWGEYLRRASAVDRDGAVLLGWTGDNGDPDNFLSVLLGCDAVGGSNRAQWCHEPFETLIRKAKSTTDRAERKRLYDQAQVIFKEEAPWATIAHSMVIVPMSARVTGFVIDPLGHMSFEGVDIAE